jgi:hypothetical protein
MRTVINVTKTIDTVLGLGRDIVVVAKRNAETLRRSVRTYLMRHAALPAHRGSWLFEEQRLQPAYALAAIPMAAARPCDGDAGRPASASSPFTRIR